MTRNKKKPSKDFSHIETDKIRATFIDNPEKAKELGKGLHKGVQRGKKAPGFNHGDEFPLCNKKRILSGCSAKTEDQNYPYNNMKYETDNSFFRTGTTFKDYTNTGEHHINQIGSRKTAVQCMSWRSAEKT